MELVTRWICCNSPGQSTQVAPAVTSQTAAKRSEAAVAAKFSQVSPNPTVTNQPTPVSPQNQALKEALCVKVKLEQKKTNFCVAGSCVTIGVPVAAWLTKSASLVCPGGCIVLAGLGVGRGVLECHIQNAWNNVADSLQKKRVQMMHIPEVKQCADDLGINNYYCLSGI